MTISFAKGRSQETQPNSCSMSYYKMKTTIYCSVTFAPKRKKPDNSHNIRAFSLKTKLPTNSRNLISSVFICWRPFLLATSTEKALFKASKHSKYTVTLVDAQLMRKWQKPARCVTLSIALGAQLRWSLSATVKSSICFPFC